MPAPARRCRSSGSGHQAFEGIEAHQDLTHRADELHALEKLFAIIEFVARVADANFVDLDPSRARRPPARYLRRVGVKIHSAERTSMGASEPLWSLTVSGAWEWTFFGPFSCTSPNALAEASFLLLLA